VLVYAEHHRWDHVPRQFGRQSRQLRGPTLPSRVLSADERRTRLWLRRAKPIRYHIVNILGRVGRFTGNRPIVGGRAGQLLGMVVCIFVGHPLLDIGISRIAGHVACLELMIASALSMGCIQWQFREIAVPVEYLSEVAHCMSGRVVQPVENRGKPFHGTARLIEDDMAMTLLITSLYELC